jgi:hypothetical protein
VAAGLEPRSVRLLSAADLMLMPDHHMFGLLSGSGDEWPGIPSAGDGVLCIGGDGLMVGTRQDSIKVAVRLESWSARPDPPEADDWEVHSEGELTFPGGDWWLNQITMGGRRLPEFVLAAGVYRLDVHGAGREQTAQAEDAIYARLHDDEAFEAWAGNERYLLRFWPAG